MSEVSTKPKERKSLWRTLKHKLIFLSIRAETDRHAWVREKLRELPAGLRILDAGAGEQPYRADCAHLKYFAQDFGEYAGAGDGVAFQTGTWDTTKVDIVSDIAHMPVEDASFDVVLCTEVFEHIRDQFEALQEFQRVLKPGGILIVTAPFGSATHFAPYHFVTGFNRYFYEENFPRFGFKIKELRPFGDYFSSIVAFMGMFPGVLNKYAKNKAVKLFIIPAAILIVPLILLVSIIRPFTKGSEEFFCFGYFVVAKKAR